MANLSLGCVVVLCTLGACGEATNLSSSDGSITVDAGVVDDLARDVDGGAIVVMLPTPPALCTPPITPADITTPKVTLGKTGQPPCTEAGLQTALDGGGVITFDCGGTVTAPFTLKITSQRVVAKKDTVLDGEGKVILSGGGTSRILKLDNGNFDDDTPTLTVQNLSFIDGHTTDVANTSATDQGGAAIYRIGGTLHVFNSRFVNNVGPVTGQDVAGGAIYSIGGGLTIIVGSVFSDNACSNGGALGVLGAFGLGVYNSIIDHNQATGHNANPGNGGNGGAITVDGPSTTGSCNGNTPTGPYNEKVVTLCGVQVTRNQAGSGALAGGLFRTVDTTCLPAKTAAVHIDQSTFDGNSAPGAGGMYLHQVNLTMTNSTVSNNHTTAQGGAGIWIEGNSGDGAIASLDLTNVTIANNLATDSLGAGFFFGDAVGAGTLLNCTVANNKVESSTGNGYAVFAAGFMGTATITLNNTIVANNQKPMPSNDAYNCQNKYGNGGGNVQWPEELMHHCSDGVTVADPALSALANNTGPVKTLALTSTSPAATSGSGCPATDARGHARPANGCASGAYQP